jgi:hypothetical protein
MELEATHMQGTQLQAGSPRSSSVVLLPVPPGSVQCMRVQVLESSAEMCNVHAPTRASSATFMIPALRACSLAIGAVFGVCQANILVLLLSSCQPCRKQSACSSLTDEPQQKGTLCSLVSAQKMAEMSDGEYKKCS